MNLPDIEIKYVIVWDPLAGTFDNTESYDLIDRNSQQNLSYLAREQDST